MIASISPMLPLFGMRAFCKPLNRTSTDPRPSLEGDEEEPRLRSELCVPSCVAPSATQGWARWLRSRVRPWAGPAQGGQRQTRCRRADPACGAPADRPLCLQPTTSASTGSARTTVPRSTRCARSRTRSRAHWPPSCPTCPWPRGRPGGTPGDARTTSARRQSALGAGWAGDSGVLPPWGLGRAGSHQTCCRERAPGSCPQQTV